MSTSRFHHVGYVTRSIATSVEGYVQCTGLAWDGQIIHDPLQMVCVAFLTSAHAGAGMVELVEPAGRRSPVNKFLESGGGLHHICLEVESLEAHLVSSQAEGATLIRVPLPAVAFGGRKIAWITTKSGQLMELLDGMRP